MEATMARRTLIRLLSFTCLAVIGPGHQSQAQSPSNPTSPPKELICETVADNGEAICRRVPDKTLEKVGERTWETAWSLYVTRNLATLDSTKKFLKGIAGEIFAQKAAPTAFREIKSSRARYSILAAGLFGGGLYLYE